MVRIRLGTLQVDDNRMNDVLSLKWLLLMDSVSSVLLSLSASTMLKNALGPWSNPLLSMLGTTTQYSITTEC